MSESTTAPFQNPGATTPAPQRVPLFTIGNLPVQVWAPVEPVYDSQANRNLAAYPSWETVFTPEQPDY